MKWLFRLIFRGQYHQIQHMRGEIEWLRAQLEHERQRSEQAIDECRMRHQNLGPVTVPPRPVTVEQLQQQAKSLMGDHSDIYRNLEVAAMGNPDGI